MKRGLVMTGQSLVHTQMNGFRILFRSKTRSNITPKANITVILLVKPNKVKFNICGCVI